MLRTAGGCCEEAGDGSEKPGEDQQGWGEGDGGGEGTYDQWATGVAEFATDFGGTHRLAESFFRGR